MTDISPDFSVQQERDFDAMENIFKSRMRLKKLSQISWELKALEHSLTVDAYDTFNAQRVLQMYGLIEQKVLEVAEDIKNNT